MTNGKNKIVTGLHIVSSRRKHGKRYYVYAWRGGPCIHQQDIERPVIGPELLDKAAKARIEQSHRRSSGTLDSIIDSYRTSPEFEKLRPSTTRDYRMWLDRISDRFGNAPIAAFADLRMKNEIILWRGDWRNKPRTADRAKGMMATLLGYAVQRGLLSTNVAAGIRNLHSVNKADQIWERRHFRAMIKAPAPLRDAVRLAMLTGLRVGDLIRLNWDHVGDQAIILTTSKSSGRAVVPITPALRHHLERREWREGTILRSSLSTPWSAGGIQTAIQRAKPKGFDRTFHDLRGTYITWLAERGLTDQEIARIVGWTAHRVSQIRARYVDEQAVVISLIDRLSA